MRFIQQARCTHSNKAYVQMCADNDDNNTLLCYKTDINITTLKMVFCSFRAIYCIFELFTFKGASEKLICHCKPSI